MTGGGEFRFSTGCPISSKSVRFANRNLASSKVNLPNSPQDTGDLLVIDEVGRFELKGEIWADCISHLTLMPPTPMIWTVRRFFVDAVIAKWPMTRTIIIELGSVSKEKIIRDIMEEVRISRSGT